MQFLKGLNKLYCIVKSRILLEFRYYILWFDEYVYTIYGIVKMGGIKIDDILKKIDDLHFDIKQLKFNIMDDLNIDNYGKWSIEIIETKLEYEDIVLFHDLEENKVHYYEEDYSNPIKIMRGNEYTYIQNDKEYWLVCLNEKEVK